MHQNYDLPHVVFLISTVAIAVSVILIFGFLFLTAAPVLAQEGLDFILGTEWNYDTHTYGILPYLGSTIVLTVVTLALAVPLSLFTAIYLAEWAPAWLEKILRPPIELLVGIPSVVYGIFGYLFLEDIFQYYVDPTLDGTLGRLIPIFHDPDPARGFSVLLAATVLTVMILPTITALSQEAIRRVSDDWREASFALGATKWETIRNVVLPAALPGILTGIILGTMRAFGETMAVIMLMGGREQIPTSLLDAGYVMTTKLVSDVGNYIAYDEARSALFGIGCIIFVIEILFVAAARASGAYLTNRGR